jgi:hypothetical protein
MIYDFLKEAGWKKVKLFKMKDSESGRDNNVLGVDEICDSRLLN